MARNEIRNLDSTEILKLTLFLKDILCNPELQGHAFPKIQRKAKSETQEYIDELDRTLSTLIKVNESQIRSGRTQGVHGKTLEEFYNNHVSSEFLSPYRRGRRTSINPYMMSNGEKTCLANLIIQQLNKHGVAKLSGTKLIKSLKKITIIDIQSMFEPLEEVSAYYLSLIWYYLLSNNARSSIGRQFNNAVRPPARTISIPSALIDKLGGMNDSLEDKLLVVAEELDGKLSPNEIDITVDTNTALELEKKAKSHGVSLSIYLQMILLTQ